MHDPGKQRRYETRDVSARSMAYSALAIVLLTAAGLAASWAVMKYFVTVQKLGPPASPFDQTRTIPPEPRLSVNPVEELRKYEQRESERLDNYGWVDRNAGIVHIPIERAIELSLRRGFPVRSKLNARIDMTPRASASPAAPKRQGP